MPQTIDRQTDRQTETDRRTDRHIDRHTDRQTGRQTDRTNGTQVEGLSGEVIILTEFQVTDGRRLKIEKLSIRQGVADGQSNRKKKGISVRHPKIG